MTPRMRWFALITSFVLLVAVVTLTAWQVSKIEDLLNLDACRFAAVDMQQSNRQIDLLADAGVYTPAQADAARAESEDIAVILCPPEGVER